MPEIDEKAGSKSSTKEDWAAGQAGGSASPSVAATKTLAADVHLEAYRQCHEHLKETDKKRDQLAGLYAVVVGLVLSNLDKIGQSKLPALVGLGLTGLLVMVATVHYRKWHITYVRCAQVLAGSEPAYAKEKGYKLNPLLSAETALFYAIAVITYIPWQFVVAETGGILNLPSAYWWIAVLLNVAGYILLMVVYARWILAVADAKRLDATWILTGVRAQTSRTSPKSEQSLGD